PTIQKIKAITIRQRLGKLISAKTFATWPRSSAYYKRNAWAGKYEFNGKKIYDSPMMNAVAHFLQNMLYVAGAGPHSSACPVKIYSENYRAKEIASADTQYLRLYTDTGVKIQFIATHAVANSEMAGPITEYQYEKGKISWCLWPDGQTEVFKKQGNRLTKTDTFYNRSSLLTDVFIQTLNAVRERKLPLSTITNAKQHILCINKMFVSSQGITPVTAPYTRALPVSFEDYDPSLDVSREKNIIIRGLKKAVIKMHDLEKSFYESGLEWACPGDTITTEKELKC
ncbi:MAG TPA: hypothetical protein VKS21_13475, partial [Spirochaetota bacterium]|nr:hypothetical protein [Spirochaetota bacterium]